MALGTTRQILLRLLFDATRCPGSLHSATYPTRRCYSLSRFPTKRTVGVGRSRENIRSANPSARRIPRDDSRVQEDKLAVDESRIRDTSPRPLTSNGSGEGLQRLLMQNDTLIIERQLEMLNIFVGFEQCNKYAISNVEGEPLGFIVEEDRGFLGAMARQAFATHRPFRATVLDTNGSPVLWLRRPFAWINSRMYVQRLKEDSERTPEGDPTFDTLGEIQQLWHLWRRRYDLFLRESQSRILSRASEPQPEPEPAVFTQIAKVDAPFLAWDFRLLDGRGHDVAFISRSFRGFGRELFTDTGRYSVSFKPMSFDPEGQSYAPQPSSRVLTLDERALCLALSINIDADYFSQHSHMGSTGLFHFSSWE